MKSWNRDRNKSNDKKTAEEGPCTKTDSLMTFDCNGESVSDVTDSADEDIDSKFPTNIVVSSDGTCSWVPLGLYISSCPIDITWFPFDDQNCTMKFGSWTYDGSKINLTSMYDQIDIYTYQLNGEWKLLGTQPYFTCIKRTVYCTVVCYSARASVTLFVCHNTHGLC